MQRREFDTPHRDSHKTLIISQKTPWGAFFSVGLRWGRRGARSASRAIFEASSLWTETRARRAPKFCGLALDEDMQRDLTDERIAEWAAELKKAWPEIVEKRTSQAS